MCLWYEWSLGNSILVFVWHIVSCNTIIPGKLFLLSIVAKYLYCFVKKNYNVPWYYFKVIIHYTQFMTIFSFFYVMEDLSEPWTQHWVQGLLVKGLLRSVIEVKGIVLWVKLECDSECVGCVFDCFWVLFVCVVCVMFCVGSSTCVEVCVCVGGGGGGWCRGSICLYSVVLCCCVGREEIEGVLFLLIVMRGVDEYVVLQRSELSTWICVFIVWILCVIWFWVDLWVYLVSGCLD